jgi:arylsulfatase A-like enzyme
VRPLTRRTLLRRGGIGAAGAGLLGAAALPELAAAQDGDGGERGENALLVVLPLVRADFVDAFEGDAPADTPNLNDLTGQSLRFDRAIPESMPGLPARRALITGMRSFPFRDWIRTDGLAPIPGFNPIWDHQPVLTETLRGHGVETVYVSDNPILEGPRWPDVVRTGASYETSVPTPGIDSELIPSIKRQTKAAEATFAAGLRELDRLRGERFFLAIDPFDPLDATYAPPVYTTPHEVEVEGIGPMNDRLAEVEIGGDEIDKVRAAYTKHVERVDELVGRLVDRLEELDLLDSTLLVAMGDQGIALGDHDFLGIATPTSHRIAYEVPFLIRDPDGRKAGDDIDWYATTHDIAPTILSFMGATIPGKMGGEDLTALLDDVDQWDLYHRGYNVTAMGELIVIRDKRFLVVADREQIERRMYDDDEEVEDDITRFQNVANEDTGELTELSVVALAIAGGTLPEFGPDGALRPPPDAGDDDTDDDGIPNDFDAVDNEEPEDGTEPGDFEFDGRIPEGGKLPPNEATPEAAQPRTASR